MAKKSPSLCRFLWLPGKHTLDRGKRDGQSWGQSGLMTGSHWMSGRVCLMSLAVVLWAQVAGAVDFDYRMVPAETQWVVHVDFDALRSSTTAQQLSAQWLQRASTQEQLDRVRQLIGTDLLRDLHGATLFGTSYAPSAAVVLLQAKVDRQRVRALLSIAPDFRTKSHGQHELCTWTHRERDKEKSLTACLTQQQAIIVGEDPEQVVLALDTFEGRHPSVPEDSPLAAPRPEGTVLFAAAYGLDKAELPFRSPLVRQAQRMILAVGESKQQVVFLQATTVARDTESAEQFRAALDGLRALALLQSGSDPQVAGLFKQFELSVQEQTVRLEWRVPARQLIELIQKVQQAQKHKGKPPKAE